MYFYHFIAGIYTDNDQQQVQATPYNIATHLKGSKTCANKKHLAHTWQYHSLGVLQNQILH